jgi:hypothetical protein
MKAANARAKVKEFDEKVTHREVEHGRCGGALFTAKGRLPTNVGDSKAGAQAAYDEVEKKTSVITSARPLSSIRSARDAGGN